MRRLFLAYALSGLILTHLMTVLARACGHRHLSELGLRDLTTWSADIAKLTGIRYAGIEAP